MFSSLCLQSTSHRPSTHLAVNCRPSRARTLSSSLLPRTPRARRCSSSWRRPRRGPSSPPPASSSGGRRRSRRLRRTRTRRMEVARGAAPSASHCQTSATPRAPSRWRYSEGGKTVLKRKLNKIWVKCVSVCLCVYACVRVLARSPCSRADARTAASA